MSAFITAENLRAGSKARDADIALIKYVVHSLSGLLLQHINTFPDGKQVLVWLLRNVRVESKERSYGIKFVKCSNEIDVCLVVNTVNGTGSIPWNSMRWRFRKGDIPREHIADFAGQMDHLIREVVRLVPAIEPDVRFLCERGVLARPSAQIDEEATSEWKATLEELLTQRVNGNPLRLYVLDEGGLDGEMQLFTTGQDSWSGGAYHFFKGHFFYTVDGERKIFEHNDLCMEVCFDGTPPRFLRKNGMIAYRILGPFRD